MMKALKTFFTVTLANWNAKHPILVASLWFAVTVSVVFLVVFGLRDFKLGDTSVPADRQDGIEIASDSGEDVSEQMVDESLQCDAYPEVNEVIKQYHKALAEDDQEAIKKYLLYVSEDELITISVKSEYVESYEDIKCYTQPGYDENSYFVYVLYQLKLKDYDTLVPGLSGLYYCPNEAGEYHIYRKADMSEAVLASFYQKYSAQEVQDLYKKVKLDFDTILDSDEELKAFMDGFEVVVRDEVVKRIAIREANEALIADGGETDSQNPDGDGTGEGSSEESGEGDAEGTEEIVKATTTVNVRSSDSENADRLGKVTTGTTLTRLEQKLNGWSKVIYEGKEGYIKSEYLVSLDDNGEVASTGNYVTVKENVNIRAEASETADRLGLAYQGTKLEVIEKLSNGWTKVKFEGKEAYVKSEFVE